MSCSRLHSATFGCLLLITFNASADDVVYNDPSDVTSLVTSIAPVVEYHRYENQERPDDGLWEVKFEGQYSQNAFLVLADVGYGYRTGNNESGIVDSRIRFFHVPYRNDDPSAWIAALGWSVDSYIPFGDVEKGLGSGNWVIAPGIIWTHDLDIGLSISPNFSFQFTWPDSELRDGTDDELPNSSQAIRLELNFAVDVPDRYWLLITPAYTAGLRNTDDGGYLKVFTGINLTPSMALGIEGQVNFEVREGLLQEVIRGEKYRIRIHWENYF
jgi:hypothetical protein